MPAARFSCGIERPFDFGNEDSFIAFQVFDKVVLPLAFDTVGFPALLYLHDLEGHTHRDVLLDQRTARGAR